MILIPGKITVGPIDSCSWGSGGKSKIIDYIAAKENPYFAISHNSHNASHITVFDDGSSYKFNALPSSVANVGTKVVMGADACVQLPQMLKEIEDWHLSPDMLFIHPNMVVITAEQVKWEEENLGSIGSTMSGVGAAKGYKVMRHAGVRTADEVPELKPFLVNTNKLVVEWLKQGRLGILETAQGFDLSLDLLYDNDSDIAVGKFFPACTSRNINPAAFVGMSFIPTQLVGSVIMNLRTFPIRVGDASTANGSIILKFTDGSENSYKENDLITVDSGVVVTAEEFRVRSSEFVGKHVNGKQFSCVIRLGSSGKCYPDQSEISWAEVSKITGNQVKEQTSLTKRTRRVFTRSTMQLSNATMSCMPTHITINFANYLDSRLAGVKGKMKFEDFREFPKVYEFMQWVNENQYWANTIYAGKVVLVGTGSKRSEMIEVE